MKCPKFGFEITDALKQSYCLNCVEKCDAMQSRVELGKVDVFRLARLLKEKKDKEEGDRDRGVE